MKVFLDNPPPKVCFLKPGDVIELPDEPGTLYLVCCYDLGQPRNPLASNGLYSNFNPHFLVELVTGQARKMPHPSSRARIRLVDVAVYPLKEQ